MVSRQASVSIPVAKGEVRKNPSHISNAWEMPMLVYIDVSSTVQSKQCGETVPRELISLTNSTLLCTVNEIQGRIFWSMMSSHFSIPYLNHTLTETMGLVVQGLL